MGESVRMGNSNSLTVKFVEQLRTPGVYRDGLGLLLRVEPSGAKRWVLRTTVNGRRRDIGLGSAREVTLREARDEATALRKLARSGQDPVAHRRKVKQEQLSFAQAAEKVHAQNTGSWRNGKHVSATVVRTRLPRITPCKAIFFISRATVQRATSKPSRRNCRQTLRTP